LTPRLDLVINSDESIGGIHRHAVLATAVEVIAA